MFPNEDAGRRHGPVLPDCGTYFFARTLRQERKNGRFCNITTTSLKGVSSMKLHRDQITQNWKCSNASGKDGTWVRNQKTYFGGKGEGRWVNRCCSSSKIRRSSKRKKILITLPTIKVYDHETVKHSVGEYVNGQIHTKFWSMLKAGDQRGVITSPAPLRVRQDR